MVVDLCVGMCYTYSMAKQFSKDRKVGNNTEKAVLIWTPDGCWFQRTDRGVTRISHLGHIGDNQLEILEWCNVHGIEFDSFSNWGGDYV